MGFGHEAEEALGDVGAGGEEVGGFGGVFVEIVELVDGIVGADAEVDEFPRAFADCLAAAGFLEFEVEIIVLFLGYDAHPS